MNRKIVAIISLATTAGLAALACSLVLRGSPDEPTADTDPHDPWALVGQQWNPAGLQLAATNARLAFEIDRHRPTTIRLDERLDKVDLVRAGTITGGEAIEVSLSKALIEPEGWRFRNLDIIDTDVGAVVAEIDLKNPDAAGMLGYFFMFWHYDTAEPRYFRARRSLKVYLRPGLHKYYLTLPTNHLLGKKVHLSFWFPTVEPGEYEFTALTILPTHAPFVQQVVGTAEPMLQREIRPVIYQWTSGDVAFPLTIPDHEPVFKFGTGLLTESPPTTFAVTVEDETGAETTVFESHLREGNVWTDEVIDLARWRGRDVRLHLKSRSGDPTVAMWSSPRVVSRTRTPRIFCIYLVDALRPDFVAGYPPYDGIETPTPALRALGEEGVTFRHAFSNASHTRYSIPALLCGLLPSNNGIMHYDRVPDAIDTMPEILRREGFVTASFIFNANAGRETNLQKGFDHVFTAFRLVAESERLGISMYPEADRLGHFEVPVQESRHMINDFLFDFVRAHRDEDLFLYLHVIDTHMPYFPEPRFRDGFRRVLRDHQLDPPAGTAELYEGLKDWRKQGWPREAVVELYRGAARAADHHFGRFVDFLRGEGLYDRTTLVFTADHGEHLGDRHPERTFVHSNPLDRAVLKIPLLARSPDLPAGTVVREAVQLVDLLPTLLDLAGIDYDPLRYDGVSLLGLVGGESPDWFDRRPIVSNNESWDWSVLAGGLHAPDIRDDRLIYDWRADPLETTPLTGERRAQAHRQLIEALKRAPRRTVPREREQVLVRDEEVTRQLRALGYLR